MTNQNNTTDKNVNLLDTVRRLHFVGIGGSGMCPMAEILHHKDYIITGSDINESDTLARIRSYGIPVHMGHRAENIGDAEVVVYTAAAKQDNPELVAARAKGIPTLERSVMLGLLTKKFANPIAVSGTHGKTTTTGTLDNIVKSFHQFCLQTSKRIIVNADNANAMRAVEGITNAEIVTFGRTDKSDYYVTELNEEDTVCEDFTVMYKGERVCRVSLRVPGEHNMMNALAAAAAAHGMGVDGEHIKKALEDFSGVHRRFEILGKFEGVTVADDFAHHPTELSAVLSAAVRMGYHEVWAVFQPHTYSRTAMLLDDFAKALSIPQHVVMTEILAVRETNTYNIHTSDLAAKIPGSCWFGSFEEIADYVMTHAKENDLILTLGGGDIYKCANLIVEKYKERA